MNFLAPITPATTGPELMPMRKASRRPPNGWLRHGLLHVERELDQHAGVVGAPPRHPGRHHVAVADGLDLLEVVALDQRVEALEHVVQELDQAERRHAGGHRREVDDVGKEDAGLVELLGDGARAHLQRLRDLARQDVEQQHLGALLEVVALAHEVVEQPEDHQHDGAEIEHEEPRHQVVGQAGGARCGSTSAPITSRTTKPTIHSRVLRRSSTSSEPSGQSAAHRITALDWR